MKKKILFLGGIALVVMSMASCKGRTSKDVEANGETIEVDIPHQAMPETQSLQADPRQASITDSVSTENPM